MIDTTATIAELRQVIPKATAAFREACFTDGLTVAEALARRNAELEAHAIDLEGVLAAATGGVHPDALKDPNGRDVKADNYDHKLARKHGANLARFAASMRLDPEADK